MAAIARISDSNPVKRLLRALSYRIMATLAAGAIAIPVEPIPGFDILYDVAVPILLLWYWVSFFKNSHRTRSRLIRRESR
jgi:hypothetical protein